MTKDELDAIEARWKATTPGEWVADLPDHDYLDPCIYLTDDTYIAQTAYDNLSTSTKHNVKEDAEFIAHAHQDIPALLAEVRRLQAEELGQLKTAMEKAVTDERERCARLCEQYADLHGAGLIFQSLATDIRYPREG